MVTFHILTSLETSNDMYYILYHQFQELMKKQWEVRISLSYRECNKVGDYLANIGHSFRIGFHIIEPPDPGLNFWILYDNLAISQTRLI
ncbi:unnamed protein product [Linum tenue]|uniref:RNase H type-1 domain-containing protein n=1 Tax=Linum tenue TaxID=586396 RepID=A0AAV0H913_9ROSI|nr:unnamed protein product [Linum tenue]CAI0459657.1 unnamed protein product [Linum tenue]